MKINWKQVPDALKVLGRLGEKHLPSILTGLGVIGFIGTAVLAAKEAPKAETAVVKAEREKTIIVRGEIDPNKDLVKLNPWEYVKTTAGYYWPSVGLGTASTIAILSAHKIDLTRLASVTAAYQLSKGELKDLKNKIIQKDGPEKLKEYEKDVHHDILSAGPPTAIYNTGKGVTIFYDPTSGTYFYSDQWHVENALRSMISTCKEDGSYDLAELRQNLGLPRNEMEGDYAFYYESLKDIDENRIPLFLYEYHDTDAENGDSRPCIWLKIADRIYNKYDYAYEEERTGNYFRSRRK